MTAPRLTLVIVTHNSADVLGDALASIELHAPDVRVLVVDNASEDGSADLAAAAPFVTVTRSAENEGFSKANNRALRTIAKHHPTLHVLEWDAMARAHPSWFGSDGVHPSMTGYRERAKATARLVKRC